jgi:hypothetical protein
VGEITINASIFRPVYHVKDRDGKKTIVALYFDNASEYVEEKRVKVGDTISIIYAMSKQFMDGSEGIRVDDGDSFQGVHHFSSSVNVSVAVFFGDFDGDFRVGCFA